MAAPLTADVLQDELAVSLARALAAANRRAREAGVDATESIITIGQHAVDDILVWRINYGPRNYVGRRGGDLVIEVDPTDASIRQVRQGQ